MIDLRNDFTCARCHKYVIDSLEQTEIDFTEAEKRIRKEDINGNELDAFRLSLKHGVGQILLNGQSIAVLCPVGTIPKHYCYDCEIDMYLESLSDKKSMNV
jgi:hypothetical protein